MQRDFLDPGGYAAKAGLDISRLREPITSIRALLAAARHERVNVVHTREGHLPDLRLPAGKARAQQCGGRTNGSQGPLGRLLLRGEYGHDFIDELRPWPGELVVDKPGYSAFEHTDLQAAGTAWHRH
jgi:nicotinamidase-related amidase